MVKLALGLLAATFLGAGVVLFSTGPVAEAQFTPPPKPPVWEYRVLNQTGTFFNEAGFKGVGDYDEIAAAVEEKYNKLGTEGWEYCSDDGVLAVFKRPKVE